AALSVFTGLVVLFSIASHQARTRLAEVQLLKTLGGGTRTVAKIFFIEFGAIGLLASLFGVLLSTGLSYWISGIFFDFAWDFSPWLPLAIVAAITGLTLLTTHWAVRRSLAQKPAQLLAEGV